MALARYHQGQMVFKQGAALRIIAFLISQAAAGYASRRVTKLNSGLWVQLDWDEFRKAGVWARAEVHHLCRFGRHATLELKLQNVQ